MSVLDSAGNSIIGKNSKLSLDDISVYNEKQEIMLFNWDTAIYLNIDDDINTQNYILKIGSIRSDSMRLLTRLTKVGCAGKILYLENILINGDTLQSGYCYGECFIYQIPENLTN